MSDGKEPSKDKSKALEVDGKSQAVSNTPKVKQNKSSAFPLFALYGLFKYAGPSEVILLIIATILSCAQGAALPALFLVFGGTIDTFGQAVSCQGQSLLSSSPNIVGNSVLPFVYIGIAQIFTGYGAAGLTNIIAARIARIWRLKYLQALMNQDVEFFDIESTPGALLASLNEDTLSIEQALGVKYGSFFQYVCMFIAGIVIAIAKSWRIGLVMFSLVPALIASLGGLNVVQSQIQKKRNKLYEGANDIVSQYLTQIRTVASYNAQGTVIKQFIEAAKKPTSLGYTQGFYEGLGIGGLFASIYAINALGWWFGGDRIRRGILTSTGDVNIAIFGVIIGGFSLSEISRPLVAFNRGLNAKIRMENTIEHKPRIDSNKPGKEVKEVTGNVELQEVSFAYPARPEFLVFKNFNLKIEHGTSVALVGQSGSGKSTIVQLVQRFYDPTYGRVLIDGTDLREYQLKSIRRHIGLVNQEPILFSGTIRQNIIQGKIGATDKEMIDAAKNANVHDFIEGLPDKYETLVGPRGVSLSGGQKQRVTIARAILKNPQILLLDEATSALDNKSEKVVQQALNNLAQGRTTIVVAHRLSTIRNSTVIAAIREGEIVEQGSHEELIQKPDGFYTNLVKIQIAAGDLEMKENDEIRKQGEVERSQIDEDKEVQETAMQEASFKKGQESSLKKLQETSFRKGQLSSSKRKISTSLRHISLRNMEIKEEPEIPQPQPQTAGGFMKMLQFKKQPPKEPKPPKKKLFGRLLKMQMPESKVLFGAVIICIVQGLKEPAQAVLTARAIFALVYSGTAYQCQFNAQACPCDLASSIESGQLTNQQAVQPLFDHYQWLYTTVAYCYTGMAVGLFFFGIGGKVSFAYMGTRLTERLRQTLLWKIMCQEIGYFDFPDNSVGSLASRLQSDALMIRGAVADTFGVMIEQIFLIVGCLVVAFIAGNSSYKLALVILATLPLFVIAIVVSNVFMMGGSETSGSAYALANNIATESASNIRVVHSFVLEDDVTSRYNDSLQAPYKKQVYTANVNGVTNGISNLITYGLYALGLWYGGLLLSRGELNVQQLFQAFFGVTFIGNGASQVQISFPDISKGGPAAKRIFEIIDREPEIDNETDKGDKIQDIKGVIEYKHIKFVYPTRAEVVIFEDFSLRCEAGQTTAMVGESGSGKSTVISLLERFYDPTQGNVFLDGRNIKELNLKWLRDSVALVAQEPVLFNATLIENIRIGRDDTSYDEAMEACNIANISDFVSQLPQKLDTPIGEKGIRLSGGQKQRIAIARAIVKNTRILLLDEATSALDANSEHLVQEALDRISKDRTTITIAHRLSTIRHANKIAVVQRGKLVEQGTHEELVKIPDGVYNGLVRAQEKKE